MKNSQQGFIIPLVIAVVLILIASGVYFSTTNKTQENSMIESTTTTSTKSNVGYDGSGEGHAGVSERGYQPSLTVVSPNGGEIYKVGETINLQWKSDRLPKDNYLMNAGIEMCDSFNGDTCINELFYPVQDKQGNYGIKNTGSIEWLIPKDIDTSKKFRFGISNAERQDSYFLSAVGNTYFTIQK